MLMSLRSWKPGTSRWAYLQTSIYAVLLAVGLPITIALNQAWGWMTFSLAMASGVCNITAAYVLRWKGRNGSSNGHFETGRTR